MCFRILISIILILMAPGFSQVVLEWESEDLNHYWYMGDRYFYNPDRFDFDVDGTSELMYFDSTLIFNVYSMVNNELLWSYPMESLSYIQFGFYDIIGNNQKEFVFWQDYLSMNPNTGLQDGILKVVIISTETNFSTTVVDTIFNTNDYKFGNVIIYDFDDDGQDEIAFQFLNRIQVWGEGGLNTGFPNSYPDQFQLNQNYPNPFNPSTTIGYKVEKSGNVKIQIFNIKGQMLEILSDDYKTPGSYSVNWNPSGLSSGQYFYQIVVDGHPVSSKKAIYLK